MQHFLVQTRAAKDDHRWQAFLQLDEKSAQFLDPDLIRAMADLTRQARTTFPRGSYFGQKTLAELAFEVNAYLDSPLPDSK